MIAHDRHVDPFRGVCQDLHFAFAVVHFFLRHIVRKHKLFCPSLHVKPVVPGNDRHRVVVAPYGQDVMGAVRARRRGTAKRQRNAERIANDVGKIQSRFVQLRRVQKNAALTVRFVVAAKFHIFIAAVLLLFDRARDALCDGQIEASHGVLAEIFGIVELVPRKGRQRSADLRFGFDDVRRFFRTRGHGRRAHSRCRQKSDRCQKAEKFFHFIFS